jgi:hypothetical protein
MKDGSTRGIVKIGPSGMDGEPEKIMNVLKKAVNNGKGVTSMKIFLAGEWNGTQQREESLNFVVWRGMFMR